MFSEILCILNKKLSKQTIILQFKLKNITIIQTNNRYLMINTKLSTESLTSRDEGSPEIASPTQPTRTKLTIKELGRKLALQVITDPNALIKNPISWPLNPTTPKGTPGWIETINQIRRQSAFRRIPPRIDFPTVDAAKKVLRDTATQEKQRQEINDLDRKFQAFKNRKLAPKPDPVLHLPETPLPKKDDEEWF